MLGIGGMGMAPLAVFLAQSGCVVSGQDDNLLPQVESVLVAHSIEILDAIPDSVDTFAYSSAINPRHPLLCQAQEKGLTLMRRGELLAQVVQNKKLIAVVGSHGKTSTTGVLIQMLKSAGYDTSYILGGFFKDNAWAPASFSSQSDWVVAEIDESDGTIDHFSPEVTLMVNFDWDHPSQYPERSDLVQTFEALFKRTKKQCYLPAGTEFFKGEHTCYFNACNDDFNAHNENAAHAVCSALTGEAFLKKEDCYAGIWRRQDVLFASETLTIVADYAHHPTEVDALLRWSKAQFSGQVIAVFQPHRYSRTKLFASEFAQALKRAEHVILLPVYAACEQPIAGGQSDAILEAGDLKWSRLEANRLASALDKKLSAIENATLLFIGAGDIEGIATAFAQDYKWVRHMRSELTEDSSITLNEPLAPKTTLRVGGAARFFAEPASTADLSLLLKKAKSDRIPVFVLGRGSNLIITDEGFAGLVIRLSHPHWKSVHVLEDKRLYVGAGVRLKELCGQAAKLGLSGLEFLEGIPGSLGGSLRMNAGAMGGWMFDVVESVQFITMEGVLNTWPVEQFQVGYRHCSELNHAIAIGATVRSASAEDSKSIRLKMETYASNRKESQPKEPSAGCIFKNPEGQPAGKLIDELGLKGTSAGVAEVSQTHGNFIINRGGATSADVIALINQVRAAVKTASGIELQPEVLLVGKTWEEVLL